MKIEGLGETHKPDPAERKPRDTEKADETRDSKRRNTDSVELTKNRKRAESEPYSSGPTKKEPAKSASERDIAELRRNTRAEISTKDSAGEKKTVSSCPDNGKVADVRRKKDDGFYDDPSNYGSIADKIIKHFGL